MGRSSTPRSLLLIDEFGKGTAPADGIGLVAALLRHLAREGRKCLFTLHFHEIFRFVQFATHSLTTTRQVRLQQSDIASQGHP